MADYPGNAAINKQISGNGRAVGDPPSTPALGASSGKKGGKSTPAKLVRRKYSLRSSMDGIRVLRPRNAPAATPEPVVGSSEMKGKRGRKKSVVKKKACGEFESIRSQCKYLLNRINYEQNLLDAYAAEGWRGQSLEKIRPEKELQRATSEITRCKIKLRDFFKNMDTLCAEGKLDESLFDSQGEIDSEDIFCSKCGLKDMSADNDIILCDGACDRGFHQMCLVPPLLKDQIPANDESWLCPGCDCKIDCIESVNHALGTKYSIEDKWEKIFPEAAAAVAGDKHGNNALDLPSDDSEDDDYNPDDQMVEPSSGNEESSNSVESSESFISDNIVPEDSSPSNCDKPVNPGDLPSDDSEDDDYDPLRRNPEEKVKTEGSTSDESDFSSDTDDLGGFVEDNGSLDPDETHATSALSRPENSDTSYNKYYCHDHRPAVEDASNLHSASTIVRRNQDHLPHNNNEYDFKNSFSGLSGEPLETPKKRTRAHSSSPILSHSDSGQKMAEKQTSQAEVSEGTSGGLSNKLESGCAAESCEDVSELYASEKKVTSLGSKTFSAKVTKTLNDQFKQGMYPTKEKKESLSKELGLSVYQVSRWFENARRKSRHSSMTFENKTGSSPLTENSAKADANIVLSQPISEKTEHVVDSDGTFNSETQEAKNKRNSAKPSVDSRTAGLANADATVTNDMEIDAPKVVLTADNGRKSISSLPPGTRFKTKSKRRYSQLQSN